jgi:hypothetical protein
MMLKFNVGGQMFTTTPLTIRNSSFLKALVDDRQEEYFIDRSPEYFRIILNYLRTGILDVPADANHRVLEQEFAYYGMDSPDVFGSFFIRSNCAYIRKSSIRKVEVVGRSVENDPNVSVEFVIYYEIIGPTNYEIFQHNGEDLSFYTWADGEKWIRDNM